jgi:hypothetical protein
VTWVVVVLVLLPTVVWTVVWTEPPGAASSWAGAFFISCS